MRAALLDDAREMQARWGCPAVAHARVPLDPDLRQEAEYVARVTDTAPADTCPLACVTYAAPWVAEVTRAVALATDWKVDPSETVGRDLTAIDLAALAALKQAQGDAWTSDQEIREQELAQKRPPGKRG
jgi:hypothetical protein